MLYPEDWEYSANEAEIKNINNEQIKQFSGNVLITKGSLELKTKQALQYPERDQIHLYGNIQMIDDSTTIECEQLVYHTNKNYSVAYNNVIITQQDKVIYCDTLYYWDAADSLKGLGNIRIFDDNASRRLQSEQLYIAYLDSLTQVLKLSKSAEVFNMTQAKISDESPMMLFENELKGEKIEVVIKNDSISSLNIYGMAIADYNVVRDSLLMGVNNVSGDSIMISFSNNELNRMQVFGGGIGEFIPEKGNSKVDSIVYYKAEYIDYIIQAEQSILNKNAAVDYGQTSIESGNIIVDWDTNILDAQYAYDTYPIVLKSNESPMIGESMKFDLINKQGVIKKGKTDFDDGFYQGRTIQREEPNILHMFHSKYTSCSLDHPHYYFGSKRMKMIQGDKVVARPLILYIADFPIIGFPFAILPNKGGGRRTGWIMPSFGNSQSRGNFIQNLGYYWAPNDFLDFKVLMSLYDLKGFNLKSYFRYKKRYQYDGSIRSTLKRDLYMTDDIINIFTDSTTQDWDFHWVHNQKFDPYQSLNIDITYITSNNFYQSDNIGFDLETRLKQKIESSVNYTKTWPDYGNTFTLYLAETYDMITFDNSPEVNPTFYKTRTLPKVTFRRNSKRIFGEGNNWYNNIFGSISSVATGNQKLGFYAQNYGEFDVGEQFFDDNENNQFDEGEAFIDNKIDTTDYNSGVIHNFNFSFSDKVFKWFSITPTLSLKESWIFRYKEYDLDENNEFLDSYNYNNSFKRRLSGSLSMSVGTKLFGIIPIQIGRLNSIRHVLSPTVSFSYLPDLSNNSSLFQTSQSELRDYFSGSLVGGTPTTTSRRYSLTVRNDFQIKYQNNSNKYEKANFLNWTLSTSYNPETDLKWSNISSSIQANIPKLFDIDISMIHDLYKQEYNPETNNYNRVNKFEPFPRLTYISASTDIGLSGNKFNYNQFDAESNIKDTLDFDEKSYIYQSNNPYEPIIEEGKVWDTNLRLHYSLQSYNEGDKINWNKTFWVNSDINMNLSSNWKMTYSARFDLADNTIVNHSIYLFRPLHCWEFSFKWWPSGNNKGFLLNIYVKNPDLRDVKIKSTGGSFFGL
tara:strand:+ start:562 stop:3789 length:3228 start_codon:yes stop_codon:yes gene_type:complete